MKGKTVAIHLQNLWQNKKSYKLMILGWEQQEHEKHLLDMTISNLNQCLEKLLAAYYY